MWIVGNCCILLGSGCSLGSSRSDDSRDYSDLWERLKYMTLLGMIKINARDGLMRVNLK